MPRGTVVEATFLGNIVDYQLDIGGAVVRVQGDRRGLHAVGCEVLLVVPATECVLMQDGVDAGPLRERDRQPD